jgi:phosphoglycerate kinase
MAMLDIGPRTAESYARAIARAKTVLWNGRWACSRRRLRQGHARDRRRAGAGDGQGATTIVGGGDSAAAVEQAGSPRR